MLPIVKFVTDGLALAFSLCAELVRTGTYRQPDDSTYDPETGVVSSPALTAASATLSMTANPSAGETVGVGGITFTLVSGTPGTNQAAVGATCAATAANLVAAITAGSTLATAAAAGGTAAVSGADLTWSSLTAASAGADGNQISFTVTEDLGTPGPLAVSVAGSAVTVALEVTAAAQQVVKLYPTGAATSDGTVAAVVTGDLGGAEPVTVAFAVYTGEDVQVLVDRLSVELSAVAALSALFVITPEEDWTCLQMQKKVAEANDPALLLDLDCAAAPGFGSVKSEITTPGSAAGAVSTAGEVVAAINAHPGASALVGAELEAESGELVAAGGPYLLSGGVTRLTATARSAGTAGNAIGVAETLAAGSWDGTALAGGVDGALQATVRFLCGPVEEREAVNGVQMEDERLVMAMADLTAAGIATVDKSDFVEETGVPRRQVVGAKLDPTGKVLTLYCRRQGT